MVSAWTWHSIFHTTLYRKQVCKAGALFSSLCIPVIFMRPWTTVLARTVGAQKELGKLNLPESPPICRHFTLMSGAKFLTRSVKVWAGGNVGKECYRWHCKVSFSTSDADTRVWVLASPLSFSINVHKVLDLTARFFVYYITREHLIFCKIINTLRILWGLWIILWPIDRYIA